MFFGLSDFLKKILPKRLFYRALLIVAVPVLVLQLIITFVFFDSLWIKTNKGMTRALINEISTFVKVYDNEELIKDELKNTFSLFLDLNIELVNNQTFDYQYNERWFSPIDRTLRRELKSNFNLGEFWFNTTNYKELIDIRIKYEDGYFKFLVPKDRVSSSSARIFALWITVPAIIMVMISLIFLKNQTRPITNLARAAERFGKGEELEEFRPSGAMEIRQAGHEFEMMRKRILRHLNQRNEMLSGISHDLRTPLTRMKLQIAFIEDKDLANKLAEDINEMEKMLNEYLQFTSSSYIEKNEMFNLSELIDQVVNKYNNKNIENDLTPRVYINGRKNLINRCLNNIIDNALKYGGKVKIKLHKKNTNLFITIDDDGPGIPNKEHENVFKPFYKIDKGRADSKSSVGLGLSI
ncbi:ATP-binding protein, partial [Candidatus Pelagibacter sp.]|nr:ATP-binding protein [Candidatus Pelagibacter sp.]